MFQVLPSTSFKAVGPVYPAQPLSNGPKGSRTRGETGFAVLGSSRAQSIALKQLAAPFLITVSLFGAILVMECLRDVSNHLGRALSSLTLEFIWFLRLLTLSVLLKKWWLSSCLVLLVAMSAVASTDLPHPTQKQKFFSSAFSHFQRRRGLT